MSRAIYWRCFHCGDAFTKAQERWARDHFGDDQGDLPVCQMRLPGEHHLLSYVRKAQRELKRFYAEDTDLVRAIYAMRADHATELRREEERGYEKGLADGRALAAENHLSGGTAKPTVVLTVQAEPLPPITPDSHCPAADDAGEVLAHGIYPGWKGVTQPCDVCGEPVAVNAVSPSECLCSAVCGYAHYGIEGDPSEATHDGEEKTHG